MVDMALKGFEKSGILFIGQMMGAVIDTEYDTQCKITIRKLWQQVGEWRFEPWFSDNVAELQGSRQYHEI